MNTDTATKPVSAHDLTRKNIHTLTHEEQSIAAREIARSNALDAVDQAPCEYHGDWATAREAYLQNVIDTCREKGLDRGHHQATAVLAFLADFDRYRAEAEAMEAERGQRAAERWAKLAKVAAAKAREAASEGVASSMVEAMAYAVSGSGGPIDDDVARDAARGWAEQNLGGPLEVCEAVGTAFRNIDSTYGTTTDPDEAEAAYRALRRMEIIAEGITGILAA